MGGILTVQGRSDTRLRYRFANLEQARAHIHDVRGESLFFVRDDQLRFLPDTPVCLSMTFDQGDVTRLLHGRVAGRVEGAGTWLQIADTRPLREIPPTAAAWEGTHPPTWCGERGLLDPVPPRERERAAGAG